MYDDELELPSIWSRFPMMRPIDQVPTLMTILGTGLAMSGHCDDDAETHSFVSSHCLTVAFLPVWSFAAYRVQKTPRGGYYFLGRVPLAARAWGGNALALLLVAASAALIIWWSVSGASEHRGTADMKRAAELVEEGRLGDAAGVYRDVIDGKSSKVGDARAALAELVQRREGDPREMARVFRIAADLERGGTELVPDLFQRGYEFSQQHFEKKPAEAREALAVLDAVADLDGFNTASQLERRLLEPLVKKNPADPDLVSRWALALGEGKEEECRPLLEALRDKLGTRPGAAILGRLDLNDGKPDKAKALIEPALHAALPGYRQRHRERDLAIQGLYNRLDAEVRSRKVKDFDYIAYNTANPAKKSEMLSDLAQKEWRNDPHVRTAIYAADNDRITQRAALDLGQAELFLAQKEADAGDRQAGFARAERAYRLVHAQANRDPQYLLTLGQAYYRMGKPAEGKKAFDEAIKASKNRKMGGDLVQVVSQMLRDLGALTEARKMIEDAYNAEKDEPARRRFASTRALAAIDIDDNLAWLEKCDQEDFDVKVSLLLARARKARQQGRDADAETQCREALELYKDRPEDGATLNNSALVHFQLYELTHDIAWFKSGTERMEKAVAKIPNSSAILRNLSSALMAVLAADVAGDAMDWKAMRQRPALGHLGYLYSDEAGRKKVLDKLKAHPALPRLRVYLARLRTLAPRHPEGYTELAFLHDLLDERDELKALRGQLAGADVDTADSVRLAKEYFEGKKDEKNKDETRHAITRARDAVVKCREKKGQSLAVALSRLSSLLMQMSTYEAVDVDEVVSLAEEAHEAFPSDATSGAMVSALLFRARGRLEKADKNFSALAKKTQRSLGTYLLNWVVVRGGPMREKILADEDFKKAAEFKAKQVEAVPSGRGPMAWALLKGTHPKQAAAAAARVRGGIASDKAAIDLMIAPLSGGATLERAFALEIEGKVEEARALLREKAKAGVPLPGVE